MEGPRFNRNVQSEATVQLPAHFSFAVLHESIAVFSVTMPD
jgi:hypothetical protein